MTKRNDELTVHHGVSFFLGGQPCRSHHAGLRSLVESIPLLLLHTPTEIEKKKDLVRKVCDAAPCFVVLGTNNYPAHHATVHAATSLVSLIRSPIARRKFSIRISVFFTSAE